MESPVLLVIGIVVLLLIVIIFIVMNESRKRAEEESTTKTAQQYIDEQTAAAQRNVESLDGVTGDELRSMIEEEYQAACILAPPCPGTTVVGEDGCCELTEEQLTKFQKGMQITEGIVHDVMVSYAFAKVSSMLFSLGRTALDPSGVRRAARAVSKVAARSATRVAVRVGSRLGTRLLSRAVTLLGGPVGVAVLLLEVTSAVLDLVDPFGYNSYQANDISKNMRNAIEVQARKGVVQGEPDARTDYPMTFPVQLAFPEIEEEFMTAYLAKFLPDALEIMDQDQITELILLAYSSDADTEMSESLQDGLADSVELVTSVKRVERDNFVYRFFKDKGKEQYIEKVPWMSTYRRIGVSLSEEGARMYNEANRQRHLDYAAVEVDDERIKDCSSRTTQNQCNQLNPCNGRTQDKCTDPCQWSTTATGNMMCIQGGELTFGALMNVSNPREVCKWAGDKCVLEKPDVPEDYTPLVAMYTDKYRVLDTQNPGRLDTPNVIEIKLPRPCCLAMPLGMVVSQCEKKKGDWDPYSLGVRFNNNTGNCDYTSQFCNRYGLQFDEAKNDCKYYSEAQKYAEIVFGRTVTRTAVRFGNRVGRWLGI